MDLTNIDVGVKCVTLETYTLETYTLETYTLETCTLRDGKMIFPV